MAFDGITVAALAQEFEIKIKKRVPIQMNATAYDLHYLKTKQLRMGHILKY